MEFRELTDLLSEKGFETIPEIQLFNRGSQYSTIREGYDFRGKNVWHRVQLVAGEQDEKDGPISIIQGSNKLKYALYVQGEVAVIDRLEWKIDLYLLKYITVVSGIPFIPYHEKEMKQQERSYDTRVDALHAIGYFLHHNGMKNPHDKMSVLTGDDAIKCLREMSK